MQEIQKQKTNFHYTSSDFLTCYFFELVMSV